MNLGDVRDDARKETDDTALPSLVSDADFNTWINEAVVEVCLRSRTLQDSRQPFCTVALTAGVNRYEMDPSVLLIRRAKITGTAYRSEPLIMTTLAMLDRVCPSWDTTTYTGTPIYGCTNKDYSDHLTLYVAPTPSVDDTLSLTVWRLPVDDEHMDADQDDVPLPLEMHKDLYLWAAHRFFNRKDSEAYDPQRSDRALAMFTDCYGDRPSAHEMKLMGTNRMRGTTPQYF